MKISVYVCGHIKTIPRKFPILNPKSYLPVKFVNLLKRRLIFNMLLFLNVCKQTFHTSHMHMSQKVKGVLTWNLQHIIFKILADFQICSSVPLILISMRSVKKPGKFECIIKVNTLHGLVKTTYLVNASFLPQLSYCSIAWMWHSRIKNNETTRLNVRCLQLTYNDRQSLIHELLDRDSSVSMHKCNLPAFPCNRNAQN